MKIYALQYSAFKKPVEKRGETTLIAISGYAINSTVEMMNRPYLDFCEYKVVKKD